MHFEFLSGPNPLTAAALDHAARDHICRLSVMLH